MSKCDEFRASAREYAVRAKFAISLNERIRAKRMAKSYLLLSKSAEWIRSTDEFIAAVKNGERWPGPPTSPGAPEAAPDASDAG